MPTAAEARVTPSFSLRCSSSKECHHVNTAHSLDAPPTCCCSDNSTLALTYLMTSSAPAQAVTRLPRASGSGAYVGAGAPAALTAFGTWRGRKADFAMDYLSSRSWSEFEQPWLISRWKTTGTQVVLGVPMLMDDASTTSAPVPRSYDHHFRNLAQFLVNNGYGNATLRIGWEFNGSWELGRP